MTSTRTTVSTGAVVLVVDSIGAVVLVVDSIRAVVIDVVSGGVGELAIFYAIVVIEGVIAVVESAETVVAAVLLDFWLALS